MCMWKNDKKVNNNKYTYTFVSIVLSFSCIFSILLQCCSYCRVVVPTYTGTCINIMHYNPMALIHICTYIV